MSMQQSKIDFGGCPVKTTKVQYGKPVKEVWIDSKGRNADLLFIVSNGLIMTLAKKVRIRFFFRKSFSIFNSRWLDLCCEFLQESGKYVETPMRFVVNVQPLNSEKWVSDIHRSYILEFQPKDDQREKIITARFGNLHGFDLQKHPIICVGFNIVPVYFETEGDLDSQSVEILPQQIGSKLQVVDDLSKFRGMQNNYSDSKVETSDGVITLAHAFILAARSPVIRALFEEGYSDGSFNGSIPLPDVDNYTFDKMLRWMYSGELRMTHTALSIDRVQAAAQNYELKDLLQLVNEEKKMISNCNVGNMFQLAEIAKKNRMEFAQHYIAEFIKRNTGTSE